MSLDMKENLAEIIAIPKRLQDTDLALADLIDLHQIKSKLSNINIIDLKNYLSNDESLIEEWLLFAENKRVFEGWYILKKGLIGWFY